MLLNRVLLTFALLWAGVAHAAEPHAVTFPGPKGVTLHGWLYSPQGPGPHPAVVAMHGCGGINGKDGLPSKRHAMWGEHLAAEGFFVLMPDSFGSRGQPSQCRNADRSVRASRLRPKDANAALAYIAARPDVKPTAINLLGWSNGGSTTLYAVEPRNAPATQPDFAKAIAFYPGCSALLERQKWSTRMPLLILIGEADDWTPAAPCEALAKANLQTTQIVTYPGAYHEFDHPSLPVRVLHGLATPRDHTAHTGSDPAAREDAIKRVDAYLTR